MVGFGWVGGGGQILEIVHSYMVISQLKLRKEQVLADREYSLMLVQKAKCGKLSSVYRTLGKAFCFSRCLCEKWHD